MITNYFTFKRLFALLADRIPNVKAYKSKDSSTRHVLYMFIVSRSHLHHLQDISNVGEVYKNDAYLSLKSLTLKCNDTVGVITMSQSQRDHPTVYTSCLLQLYEFASLLDSLPFSHATNTYIVTSQQLDFNAYPQKNVLCSSSPNVQVHNYKALPEGMKWCIICSYKHYTQGLEGNFSYKHRLMLMKAIV